MSKNPTKIAGYGHCKKYPPVIDSVVRPVGYLIQRNTDGTIYYSGRFSSYDASPQFILDRRWTSTKTSGFKNLTKKQVMQSRNFFYAYTFVITDTVGTVRQVSNLPAGITATGYGRVTMGTSIAAMRVNLYGSTDGEALRNTARLRALNAMSNMKFNAAQSFAERKQTAGLLINSVNRFVSFAILLRKGKFADANKLLANRFKYFQDDSRWGSIRTRYPRNTLRRPTRDDFANAWLEYSYGWRPLLSDIYGSAELLAQTYSGVSQKNAAVGNASVEERYRTTSSDEGLTGVANKTATHSARCVLLYDVISEARQKLQQTGIDNPVLLAWELLPYSFVVDWFIPVGNYLKAVNADAGLEFVGGFTTQKSQWYGLATSTSDGTKWRLEGSNFACWLDAHQMYREVHTSFPSVSISVNLGLNISQVASGLSLLNQLFTRK